jgi:hypothetical protein
MTLPSLTVPAAEVIVADNGTVWLAELNVVVALVAVVVDSAGPTVTMKLLDTSDGVSSLSVAEHVTVVDPTGNTEPDAGLQVTGTGPSSSVALGLV